MYGQRPTNAQYDQALRQSLLAGGLSPAQAHRLADIARYERLSYARMLWPGGTRRLTIARNRLNHLTSGGCGDRAAAAAISGGRSATAL